MTLRKTKILGLATTLLLSSQAFAITFDDAGDNRGIPADYAQYRPILSESELQISDPAGKKGNKLYIATNTDFSGVVNEVFYVDKESEAFVFKMTGDHKRNELRVHKNFNTSLPHTFYHLNASIEPVNPEASMKDSTSKQNEITYLQVHNKGVTVDGKDNIPHPLLRVVWREGAGETAGHYWAVIKDNALICKGKKGKENMGKPACKSENAYKQYDLGKAKAGATDFNIIVGNSTLIVNVDGEQKVNHNIDYWSHLLSYFKAGVYNQFTNGESEAHFYQLEYQVEHK
ncbi:alginate lyase [Vibrio breoganii]|uniref:Polysaccharide lyase family 7 protein n=1 Tax=Vibrio breoganii TaxID=553239 RepID=A0ABX1UBP6_9VIBR|nr:polysaccharide lyase family 7 protein [Vibrio breoganii]NMO75391.1 polysaccharide lyase family 7 protein [Vibrio breoganii]NMR71922.1 polysaccharide lyase family 7 protein [Vibrio breoganii]PMG06444.1 alginate lyase [Vibrio breoganii]PML15435.1 alginate lyase [Vibrio breoganii]PML85144.1 alginate lyase [Vibrio breoganii]